MMARAYCLHRTLSFCLLRKHFPCLVLISTTLLTYLQRGALPPTVRFVAISLFVALAIHRSVSQLTPPILTPQRSSTLGPIPYPISVFAGSMGLSSVTTAISHRIIIRMDGPWRTFPT